MESGHRLLRVAIKRAVAHRQAKLRDACDWERLDFVWAGGLSLFSRVKEAAPGRKTPDKRKIVGSTVPPV